MNPNDAFRQAKGDEPATVLPYFAVLLLINAVISAALISVFMIGTSPLPDLVTGRISGALLLFLIILAGAFLCTLVFGGWLHLWVYILGGRQGIWQTLKAVMYGSTPSLLFGWIPFIGFIFTLWSIVLGIFGIRVLQEISSLKAILAVAVAVMIPLVLLIIVAAYFMIATVTQTGPVTITGPL
ncbi:MAG TPA: Yip1 family protein [Methanoregula sp.]|nr:Yip1 family protein [Methanoregula sp.]